MEGVAKRRSSGSSDCIFTLLCRVRPMPCVSPTGASTACRCSNGPADLCTCFMLSAPACDFASSCLWVALVGIALIWRDGHRVGPHTDQIRYSPCQLDRCFAFDIKQVTDKPPPPTISALCGPGLFGER